MSTCDEKLNEGDSRKTLRESHGGLSGKGSQPPPSHQPPACHSVPVVRALQKGGLPPPHMLCIESYRYKEGEEEGARGSEREREGVIEGARMTRTQSPRRIPLDPLPPPPNTEYAKTCGFNPNLRWWRSILRGTSTILYFWDTGADLPLFLLHQELHFLRRIC